MRDLAGLGPTNRIVTEAEFRRPPSGCYLALRRVTTRSQLLFLAINAAGASAYASVDLDTPGLNAENLDFRGAEGCCQL